MASLAHYKNLIAVECALIEAPDDIDAWDDLCSALRHYHRDHPTDPLYLVGNLAGHVRTLLATDLAVAITD